MRKSIGTLREIQISFLASHSLGLQPFDLDFFSKLKTLFGLLIYDNISN